MTGWRVEGTHSPAGLLTQNSYAVQIGQRMTGSLVHTNESGRNFDVHGSGLSSPLPAAADTRVDHYPAALAEDAVGQWELSEGFKAGRENEPFDISRSPDWQTGHRYGMQVYLKRKARQKIITTKIRKMMEAAAR